MNAIAVKNLSYQYSLEGTMILKHLSFEIAKGEMVAVAGLSGCGKSTLCYCLCGIIPHCLNGVMKGEVYVNGKNTREHKVALMAREVGMVFQNPDSQLFSPTVEDEIAFAPENMCLSPNLIRERVDKVINLLGIDAFREANPYQLSGGEKHLVSLAAVLALDPSVLVLDEVMSQLDDSGKLKVVSVLQKLHHQGKTIIMIEHDLETLNIVDRIIVLENGEIAVYEDKQKLIKNQNLCLGQDEIAHLVCKR
ncbi:MAG TPA: ABC transporter ATP-binding protein [Syntrophomonadaceae bacterium]|nr:ABC transporter ATP-binding protein [Syntrophomonadaceae bacterium]